jgi:hypothetical protein
MLLFQGKYRLTTTKKERKKKRLTLIPENLLSSAKARRFRDTVRSRNFRPVARQRARTTMR